MAARGQTMTLFSLKMVKTLFVHYFQHKKAEETKNNNLGIYGLRFPEGLNLAVPSVDLSQQQLDHLSDKIN